MGKTERETASLLNNPALRWSNGLIQHDAGISLVKRVVPLDNKECLFA